MSGRRRAAVAAAWRSTADELDPQRERYAGWHRLELGASTGQGGSWENRTEVLWSNRPLASTDQLTLADWHLGDVP